MGSRLTGIFTKSLPTRGAWIEISDVLNTHSGFFSRSPHGERGLKYADEQYWKDALAVAPHTGSVD